MTTTRTTPVLFLASVAVIALHVIDDSFLQPQPGTPPPTTWSAGSCR